ALVDGDRLALEVGPVLDRLRALLDAELVRGPQVARGEQHVFGPLPGHRRRRGDEVVAAGLHAGDQGREAHRVDRDLTLHAARDLGEEVDLEALDAAAELGHGVRGEGAVDAGLERWKLVLGKRGTGAEKSCYHDGKATLHHHESPKEIVVFLRVRLPGKWQAYAERR